MAQEYADRGVEFVFVYTREAHPGESYPSHSAMEQKLAHARAMVELWQISRPMLVDGLDGPLHRAYGLLPNMAYIVAKGGRILYRADWTDAHNIRTVLDQIVGDRMGSRGGQGSTPFYAEWLPGRDNDPDAFMNGLLLGGSRPIEEFIAAMAHAHGEPAAASLREWWSRRQAEGGG